VQFDGMDALDELVYEMRDRGYEPSISSRGWHVYKAGKLLDDEFKPRTH
jgi:hypothetical protein